VALSTIYSSESWRKLIPKTLGYNLKKITINGYEIFYFEKKFLLFKFVGAPLKGSMTPFVELPLEILGSTNINRILKKLLIKSNFFFAELTLECQKKIELNSFNKIFFKISSSYTYVLDINSEIDVVWNNITSRARNTIRKAEKNGIIVNSANKPTQSQISDFYETLVTTFNRHNGKPYHPITFFEELFKSNITFLFLIAYHNNIPCSYGIFVYDETCFYFLSGANNEIGYKYAASSLVQWHAIKFANDLKIPKYDLGGAGTSVNIDKFKESFGGSLVKRSHYYSRISFGYFLIKIKNMLGI